MQSPITIIVRWLARMPKRKRTRLIMWVEIITSLLLVFEIVMMLVFKRTAYDWMRLLLDVFLIVLWVVTHRLKKLERFI